MCKIWNDGRFELRQLYNIKPDNIDIQVTHTLKWLDGIILINLFEHISVKVNQNTFKGDHFSGVLWMEVISFR